MVHTGRVDESKTAQPAAVIPAPRVPPDQAHPAAARVAGRAGPARRGVLAEFVDLSQFPANLAEVAVWTNMAGAWREHATFLLRSTDGRWQAIGFSEPAATELVERFAELPGFDTDLLRDVIAERGQRAVTLWRAPTVEDSNQPNHLRHG
ncbi:MAG TPA: hypothetical protein VGH89_16150 [Pseudonocardia sp.]|jgi:hypothetical protein